MGSLAGTNDRPRHAWTRIWGSAQNDAAHGEPCTMLAGDRAGNIYVAGHTEGSFDGQPLIGAPDVFLSKFTADGVRVWTRILGSVNADGAYAVATDATGSVYVAGYVGASVDGLAHAGGQSDMCVWKFDSDGTRVWTRSVGSASEESAYAVVTDGAGNVYVSGYGGAGLNGQTHHRLWDLILCKFSADGVLLWTRMWGGSANDRTFGVAVDPSGNIYVPGHTEGSFDGQPALGGQDYFLSKFDPEGNRLWTRIWGTPVLDIIGGISVGADGFVYVTGGTQGAMDGQSNMGGVDISVTKFSPDGTLLRTRMYGSAGFDGYDTTVWDDRGVMYLIGATSGNLGGEPNRGGFDAFVMELAADGAPVWTVQWGSEVDETVRGGVFRAPDALYVAGLTRGSFHGEPPVGAADFYLTKWCLPQSLPVAPPAPREVTASQGPLADRVLVAWRAVASATSYEIWRGTNALTNAAVRVAESVPGTEYADTSVEPGLTYYYWVRARNAAGVSSFSSPVTGSAYSNTVDSDGDSMSDWDEIVAGSCPTNRNSCFTISFPATGARPPTGNGVIVEWFSASNRLYHLDRTTYLGQGFNISVVSNVAPTPPLNVHTDNTAVGMGPYFYRVRVQPQ
jgi:hypothetical protein